MRKGHVIVASTRAASGSLTDTSGPRAVDFLRAQGIDTPDAAVVADADIAQAVDAALASAPSVLLTSGGTGITGDDQTVEAVERHIVKHLPGIVHAFWAEGLKHTPTAIASRAVAGMTTHGTFVMTLPGSRGGVKDGCAVLEPVLGHLLDLAEGNREH
ncbi:MogA/MoaB family molybdenum cofactor biosynthesis protein [Corynebacterium massiliense]|uniref:Molybdenum cofactor biosynthesis protein B n=1 Tax=Corynebacterium massiliense DSM 45435 TaxID=1121364 RepID=A0ABY7U6J6_9CORY|nr:MogA/MoaB family molybdenum cofactor biosynthesis protein [Corynebacterium massiliense]WCZ31589.1 Molybdenum cofactor biosynthesis protein B [Corynebacterium massiliense DSM 45435]